jgi:hypothetical protein
MIWRIVFRAISDQPFNHADETNRSGWLRKETKWQQRKGACGLWWAWWRPDLSALCVKQLRTGSTGRHTSQALMRGAASIWGHQSPVDTSLFFLIFLLATAEAERHQGARRSFWSGDSGWGCHLPAERMGIAMVWCPVGDRLVLAAADSLFVGSGACT